METIANRHRGSIVALLFIVVAGCTGQLLATTCDQPVVNFKAGQLSISSNGCSLQQTLNAVSHQTGIEVDMPASAATVPVFGVLGPGDPGRVISQLLDGSPFNSTLTAKADGSGHLVRVVLSERVAFVPDKAPTAVGQLGAPAGSANVSGAQIKEERSPLASAGVNDLSDSPRPRRELDEETLRKLPPLPAGVPVAMWQLYPSLVDSGGIVPSGPQILPNGQPAPFNSNLQPSGPVPGDPGYVVKGAIGLPPLPPGIDPAIGKLYPWNLMQLIHGPVQLPNIQLPPMAQPIWNH